MKQRTTNEHYAELILITKKQLLIAENKVVDYDKQIHLLACARSEQLDKVASVACELAAFRLAIDKL